MSSPSVTAVEKSTFKLMSTCQARPSKPLANLKTTALTLEDAFGKVQVKGAIAERDLRGIDSPAKSHEVLGEDEKSKLSKHMLELVSVESLVGRHSEYENDDEREDGCTTSSDGEDSDVGPRGNPETNVANRYSLPLPILHSSPDPNLGVAPTPACHNGIGSWEINLTNSPLLNSTNITDNANLETQSCPGNKGQRFVDWLKDMLVPTPHQTSTARLPGREGLRTRPDEV